MVYFSISSNVVRGTTRSKLSIEGKAIEKYTKSVLHLYYRTSSHCFAICQSRNHYKLYRLLRITKEEPEAGQIIHHRCFFCAEGRIIWLKTTLRFRAENIVLLITRQECERTGHCWRISKEFFVSIEDHEKCMELYTDVVGRKYSAMYV